jgi:hypothetical protein
MIRAIKPHRNSHLIVLTRPRYKKGALTQRREELKLTKREGKKARRGAK